MVAVRRARLRKTRARDSAALGHLSVGRLVTVLAARQDADTGVVRVLVRAEQLPHFEEDQSQFAGSGEEEILSYGCVAI